MCLKVWPEFSSCYNQCQHKFFDLRVSGFCVLEGLADSVDGGLSYSFALEKYIAHSVLKDR